jgi:hypothetical protein
VNVRTVASGVAVLALAGMVAPVALSGSASAKAPPAPVAPSVTKCAPKTATIGKTLTIHGKGLANATSVTIGSGKKPPVVTTFTHDSAKTIKLAIPSKVTKGSDAVTVTTANGTSTAVQCTFQKAPSKSKK